MEYDFPSRKIIRLTKGSLESAPQHFNDYIMKPQHKFKQATWAERTNSATVTISHFVNESVLGTSLPLFCIQSTDVSPLFLSHIHLHAMERNQDRIRRERVSNKAVKTLMKRHRQAHSGC